MCQSPDCADPFSAVSSQTSSMDITSELARRQIPGPTSSQLNRKLRVHAIPRWFVSYSIIYEPVQWKALSPLLSFFISSLLHMHVHTQTHTNNYFYWFCFPMFHFAYKIKCKDMHISHLFPQLATILLIYKYCIFYLVKLFLKNWNAFISMFSHCSPFIFLHFIHICQHWWPVAVRHLCSFTIITHIMQLQDEHLSWWHYPWLSFNMKSEKPIQELSLSHWTLLNLKRALRNNDDKKIILCISSLHRRTVGNAFSHVYVCNSCRCVVIIHLQFSTLRTFPHAIIPIGITYLWTPPSI